MVSLLIIAHAPLASALKAVGAHIDPEAAARICACDVPDSMSLDEAVSLGAVALDAIGDGELLILSDVYGATPCNAAWILGARPRTRVVVGVNVPVLWRALNHLHEPLDAIAELAVAGGQQGVMHVSGTRPQYQNVKPALHDSPLGHDQQ